VVAADADADTLAQVGQNIRSLCIGLVYRKVAALSVADLTAGAGGMDVPSLVGSDVQKVPLFLPTATLLWAAPLQVKKPQRGEPRRVSTGVSFFC